jgi:hypothetical protein
MLHGCIALMAKMQHVMIVIFLRIIILINISLKDLMATDMLLFSLNEQKSRL